MGHSRYWPSISHDWSLNTPRSHGCRLDWRVWLDGDELSCSHCQKGGGEQQASTIKVGGCKIIGNNHGQLVCEDKEGEPAKDEGSEKKDEL